MRMRFSAVVIGLSLFVVIAVLQKGIALGGTGGINANPSTNPCFYIDDCDFFDKEVEDECYSCEFDYPSSSLDGGGTGYMTGEVDCGDMYLGYCTEIELGPVFCFIPNYTPWCECGTQPVGVQQPIGP